MKIKWNLIPGYVVENDINQLKFVIEQTIITPRFKKGKILVNDLHLLGEYYRTTNNMGIRIQAKLVNGAEKEIYPLERFSGEQLSEIILEIDDRVDLEALNLFEKIENKETIVQATGNNIKQGRYVTQDTMFDLTDEEFDFTSLGTVKKITYNDLEKIISNKANEIEMLILDEKVIENNFDLHKLKGIFTVFVNNTSTSHNEIENIVDVMCFSNKKTYNSSRLSKTKCDKVLIIQKEEIAEKISRYLILPYNCTKEVDISDLDIIESIIYFENLGSRENTLYRLFFKNDISNDIFEFLRTFKFTYVELNQGLLAREMVKCNIPELSSVVTNTYPINKNSVNRYTNEFLENKKNNLIMVISKTRSLDYTGCNTVLKLTKKDFKYFFCKKNPLFDRLSIIGFNSVIGEVLWDCKINVTIIIQEFYKVIADKSKHDYQRRLYFPLLCKDNINIVFKDSKDENLFIEYIDQLGIINSQCAYLSIDNHKTNYYKANNEFCIDIKKDAQYRIRKAENKNLKLLLTLNNGKEIFLNPKRNVFSLPRGSQLAFIDVDFPIEIYPDNTFKYKELKKYLIESEENDFENLYHVNEDEVLKKFNYNTYYYHNLPDETIYFTSINKENKNILEDIAQSLDESKKFMILLDENNCIWNIIAKQKDIDELGCNRFSTIDEIIASIIEKIMFDFVEVIK